jgi:hypothetical protein
MRQPRNPVARDLRTPKYRPRTVAPRKGKGSYRRTDNRRPDERRDGGSVFGVRVRGPGSARAAA